MWRSTSAPSVAVSMALVQSVFTDNCRTTSSANTCLSFLCVDVGRMAFRCSGTACPRWRCSCIAQPSGFSAAALENKLLHLHLGGFLKRCRMLIVKSNCPKCLTNLALIEIWTWKQLDFCSEPMHIYGVRWEHVLHQEFSSFTKVEEASLCLPHGVSIQLTFFCPTS